MKNIVIAFIILLLIGISIYTNINSDMFYIVEEKEQLAKVLNIENYEDMSIIKIKNESSGFGSAVKYKTITFKILKSNYEKNSLDYNNSDSAEIDYSYKIEEGDKYKCIVRISENNEKYNLLNITNNKLLYIQIVIYLIIILLIAFEFIKKYYAKY